LLPASLSSKFNRQEFQQEAPASQQQQNNDPASYLLQRKGEPTKQFTASRKKFLEEKMVFWKNQEPDVLRQLAKLMPKMLVVFNSQKLNSKDRSLALLTQMLRLLPTDLLSAELNPQTLAKFMSASLKYAP
jgi:hypothetical protein